MDPVPPAEPEHAPKVFLRNIGAPPGWRPKSLRKRTFFACAFVFLACLVTFAVLFSYSRSHQGLLTVDTRLHYLWTYAPTLFFTIVGACWARVAYRALQMQPWRMLAQDPTSASEALLVDYVTPITLKSLFRAVRARHFLAALILLASMALQLVTILSTGLFDVEYLSVQKNGPIPLVDTITGASHDFSNIGAEPALTIYSVQNTNLSYPEGTTSVHAVPKLSYPGVSNATLTAPVSILTSYLECQEASLHLDNTSITSQSGGLHNAPLFTYSLNTSDCLLANLTVEGGPYLDYNYEGDNFIFYDTYGNTAAVACSNNDTDVRIRISVGLIHYNITWNGTLKESANETVVLIEKTPSELFQLSASTNLLCIPHYGLQAAQVTYTTNQTTGSRQAQIQEPNSTSLQPLEGVTPQAISTAIMESISASWLAMDVLFPNPNAAVITVNDPSEGSDGYFPTNPDAFFRIMTQQYPLTNGSSTSSWFDSESLQTASSQFFGSVAAQFASSYLRRDATGTVQGSAAMVQPRLVFSSVFYAMEALLGFLFLATLLLAGPATKATTTVDPASIGGTTAIVSSDVGLIDHFHGTGTFDFDRLKTHIQGLASTNNNIDTPYGQALGMNAEAKYTRARGTEHSDTTGWRPWVFLPFLREMIPLIPLLLIVALEISLHYSQEHNGIASIDGLRSRIYASRLVPAVVFAATHILLSSMAFNVSLLHPFSTLRTSPSAAQISLLDAPLSRFALHNLWLSARRKQLALFCSLIMTITTFFLVTVSSGLFVIGDYTQSSNLTQLSWFQPSSENNDSAIHDLTRRYNLTEPLHYAEDNGEMKMNLIANGVVELNLSYPAWTYDELAFPLLSVSANSTSNATNSAAITAQVPALRTNMQCEVLKTAENNITFSPNTRNLLDVQTNFSLGCSVTTQGNDPFAIYGVPLPSRLNTSEEGSVEPRPTSLLYSYEGCDRLLGIFGYANDAKFLNYSVFACKVSYEEVQATTTFLDFPTYRISSDAPPIVDESTTNPVNSTDIPVFLASTQYGASFYNTSLTSLNGYSIMDPVSTALIYGKDGVPAEKLFQYPPDQYLIPTLQHLIRVMGAQYISYFYRTANASLPLVDSTIPATLQMNPTYRLRQNATSTRILEGLLAASGLFAIITLLTFRTRDVVKAKLGSPAATIAMIADSDFVRELQREQSLIIKEEEREVHAERMIASEGGQFSLGWWEVRGLSTSSQSEGEFTKYRWAIDIGRSD
ncbi:hypothetical protein LTR10_019295 [Elasticomyces elasticus]|uniref:Uncharacterized protein n=1 Tax=Exophiala sideris TaxID=1016849 RepID=A0ABR0IWY1_9EURO|nr:hypothetical protein LTR10_019295 [Elasticomyces elasticus]KAK5021973.1 hypothetical protein LTS07_010555 [Exophiala sideris]KAK5026036.1 hypothetical protein LTR13_010193 [Exophiala sideris]KAK5050723.1 hypothetical protein LTR69_010579 [Exophiala sideris]KAK5177208.1 hypothetical protein LTR44_010336 [Eurotiomycetes sp. CCFEE 6388]